MQTLNIIGAGRVGKSFGRLFCQHGVFEIAQIYTRNTDTNFAALQFIGAGTGITNLALIRAADVTLLTVPDDQLVPTARALLEHNALAPKSLLFHCSGSKSSQDLSMHVPALDGLQIQLASVHPVRSFADPISVTKDFSNTICTIEGSEPALAALTLAFNAIGAQLLPIAPHSKMLYHAASVFASNYLVTLMDIAIDAYCAAGVPPMFANKMAHTLATKSLENVINLGSAAALTGPIKRGDMETVECQQTIVKGWDASRGAVYQAFVAPTLALAKK